jgi:lantibiotic modifying enzyme
MHLYVCIHIYAFASTVHYNYEALYMVTHSTLVREMRRARTRTVLQ